MYGKFRHSTRPAERSSKQNLRRPRQGIPSSRPRERGGTMGHNLERPPARSSPREGDPRRRRERRHDQEALRLDRRRVDRGQPPRLPRPALHDRGRRGVHQRRHPLRRDDPPERRSTGRRSRSCSTRRASSPASRSTRARSRSRSRQGETVTEGLDGLRERLEEYRGLGARFAKWRATYSIGDGSRASTASGRTRTRSPATRRSARRRGSCRSSSPRC